MWRKYRHNYQVVTAGILVAALVSIAIFHFSVMVRAAHAHTVTPGIASATCAASPWSIVSTPNLGADSGSLSGIAALSSTDIWAVGGYATSGPYVGYILTEHWNGASWAVVPGPSAGQTFSYLAAVAAISGDDIWAVGNYTPLSGYPQTLIEHWDGSQWSIVASPNPNTRGNDMLYGVAAIATNDVWAVGNYTNSTTNLSQTLIEHWNGTSWTVVPSADIGANGDSLQGITAVSATDIWAVGSYSPDSSEDSQPLVEHWDGATWSIISSPLLPGPTANALQSITAVSPTDIWAAGVSSSGTLTEHWNGTAWSIISSPVVGTLSAVTSVPNSSEMWAAGYTDPAQETLILGWNGSAWLTSPSPNVALSTDMNQLSGLAAVSSEDVWAIGYTRPPNGVTQPLVEHYHSIAQGAPQLSRTASRGPSSAIACA